MGKGTPKEIRIGTRGSTLALAQTEEVRATLGRHHENSALRQSLGREFAFLIQVITTLGDKKQGTPEAAHGDKKDWIFECEEALVDGTIDIAIHSGKDVPLDIHPGTEVVAVLPRRAPFDAIRAKAIFPSPHENAGLEILKTLPPGATVGTASLRRKAQVLAFRPDLKVEPLRGNVPTRIKKFQAESQYDAIILASAGLERLALESSGFSNIPSDVLLPSVNQGILLAQFLSERNDVRELLRPLTERDTEAACIAERSCIGILQADCHSAVGSFAEVRGDTLSFQARVLSLDGQEVLHEHAEMSVTENYLSDAKILGEKVAEKLLQRGAAELLKCSRR